MDKAYIAFLKQFHVERDYFECHEIGEEEWKKASLKDQNWLALIKIAAGFYHYRRKNFSGARTMFEEAKKIADLNAWENFRIDKLKLIMTLNRQIQKIARGEEYESEILPIDKQLVEATGNVKISDMNNEFLLHKHKLRDRSEVVRTRAEAAINKKNKKSVTD